MNSGLNNKKEDLKVIYFLNLKVKKISKFQGISFVNRNYPSFSLINTM